MGKPIDIPSRFSKGFKICIGSLRGYLVRHFIYCEVLLQLEGASSKMKWTTQHPDARFLPQQGTSGSIVLICVGIEVFCMTC